MKKITDKQRLDYLNKQNGIAILSDDFGHWAVVGSGFQSIPKNPPDDIETFFFINKSDWRKTIRQAIDKQISKED